MAWHRAAVFRPGRGRTSWDLDRERRSLALAVAARRDRSSVSLDELPDDCEAQPQPTVTARGGRIPLPEGLENVRQEIRRNALAVVAHADDDGGL